MNESEDGPCGCRSVLGLAYPIDLEEGEEADGVDGGGQMEGLGGVEDGHDCWRLAKLPAVSAFNSLPRIQARPLDELWLIASGRLCVTACRTWAI